MTEEQRATILESLGRHGLAIVESKIFDDAYCAAEHFDYVSKDLGFAASRMFGEGPYYVLCCDLPRSGQMGTLNA